MGRRRYRNLPPEQVAELALQRLLEKIPQAKANYAQAMDEFAMDPSRQAAYKHNVARWVSVMRSPEVRNAISNAIQQAKNKYRGQLAAALGVQAVAYS